MEENNHDNIILGREMNAQPSRSTYEPLHSAKPDPDLEDSMHRTEILNKKKWGLGQKLGALIAGFAIGGTGLAAQNGLFKNENVDLYRPTNAHAETNEKETHNEYFGNPMVDGKAMLHDGTIVTISGAVVNPKDTDKTIPRYYKIESKEKEKPVIANEKPDVATKPTVVELPEHAYGRLIAGNPYGEQEGLGRQKINTTEVGAYFEFRYTNDEGKVMTEYIPASNVVVKDINPTIPVNPDN